MQSIISNINKVFESRIRLGIMSILMVNDEIDFITLKELLNITDGNLASHIKALERNKFINVTKEFVGKKPRTTYIATEDGKSQFKNHISAIEKLLKNK